MQDKILKKQSAISYKKLVKILERSRETVARNIQQLKSLGLLARTGSDKSGLWIVSDTVKLTDLQVRILKVLKEEPEISYEQLVKILEKSRKTVARNIHQLKLKNLLSRTGSDKAGLWKINVHL